MVVICRAAIALAALAASGCSGSADHAAQEVRLRVGTVFGLPEFSPGVCPSGSTAAALDLVWTPLSEHTLSARRSGRAVTFQRKEDAPHSAQELAAAIRFPGVESARAQGEDAIVVELADEPTAAAFAEVGVFDLGPFALERQEPGLVVLRSRGATSIDVIEIVEIVRGAQWRQLLGRQIDAIPNASSLHRAGFAGIRSIRAIDLPASTSVALAFNTGAGPLSGAELRRQVAQALDRRAIARVACGAADCAATWWGALPPERREPAERELALLVFDGEAGMDLAAKVIRHELRSVGVEISIAHASLEQIEEAVRAGEYEMALTPFPAEREIAYQCFGSQATARGLNVTHYESPEYDEALASGDADAIEEILERDVPAVMLYEMREFAAVDARFCGGAPTSAISWRWLADLYQCAEDEPP